MGKIACGRSGGHTEGVKVGAPQDPCDMAKATLPESQFPAMQGDIPRLQRLYREATS